MQQPVVLIGLGEMGGVFGRALLRLGVPVYPVTRNMDMNELAAALPTPQLALVAVAEKDLHPVLQQIPANWQNRLGLLQNELLPRDWQAWPIDNPTVISVWFEKKKGMEPRVLIPSPAWGPKAQLLVDALATLGIPGRVVDTAAAMTFELVVKNVYILTTNISGLVAGGTVSELWAEHESLAREVAGDVIDIQEWLTGQTFDREALIQGMLEGFAGDPQHGCMGRSAPARLERALAFADEAGLAVPALRRIAGRQG